MVGCCCDIIAQGTRYDLPNSAHSRERNCLPPRPGWQQPGALPSILPGQALVFVVLRLDLPRQALVVSVFCGQSPNQPTERIALWLVGWSNSRTHPDSCAAAGGPRAALGPAGVLGQPWALGTVAIGTHIEAKYRELLPSALYCLCQERAAFSDTRSFCQD